MGTIKNSLVMEEFYIVFAVDIEGMSWVIHDFGKYKVTKIFDGTSLNDNVNLYEDRIPTLPGIYKSRLVYKDTSHFTDCGWEYDCDLFITEVVRLESSDFLKPENWGPIKHQ